MAGPSQAEPAATLTVDLGAIQRNYRLLSERHAGGPAGAAVKADAYGLGLAPVANALWRAGCREFFVAHSAEGAALRAELPEAAVHVLNGPGLGNEEVILAHGLIPVLNSLEDIDRWRALASQKGRALPCDLHVDTGMRRLGLPPDELTALARAPGRLAGLDVRLTMSHLACADEPAHPLNGEQLALYVAALEALGTGRPSFCNSSGIFLDDPYHLGLARPGAALYGLNPTPHLPNPMAQVVHLEAKILQVRAIDSGISVGYGASHVAKAQGRLATVSVGYADGVLRALSNRGRVAIEGHLVPIVGRVSMDLMTLDVTALPESAARPGTPVEILGPTVTPDRLAEEAGTVGYEILTALGPRYRRIYVNG